MLKNLKLGARMALGFASVLLIMVILIVIVFSSLTSIDSKMNKIINVNVYKLNLYNQMSESIYKTTIDLHKLVITEDSAKRQNYKNDIDATRSLYDKAWSEMEKTPASEAGMALRKKITDAREATRPLNNKVIELALAGDTKGAKTQLEEQASPAVEKWQAALDEAITMQNDSNDQDSANATKTNSNAITIMIVMGGIAILFGIFIAVAIIRSITKPINTAVEELTSGANQVASASQQISASSQQLAASNAEQAASIEETSSTLEESSSMIQQNSENTKQAAQLAAQTKASADKGNGDMEKMISSMDEIKKSSDQIAKIIKVIDDIAFQTNILALNAAVEAARAGDAGMGFAVVAEEVRNLAQRSAQAAKDTAAMIENNIDLSQKGVLVSRKVGESLSEIMLQAKKVNELMDEISAASQEQTQGISQISKAVSQMEKATQQNAATAEESAAASEELSAQAQTMFAIVQQLAAMVKGAGSGSAVTNQSQRQSFYSNMPQNNRVKPSFSAQTPAKIHIAVPHHNTSPEDIIPLDKDRDDF